MATFLSQPLAFLLAVGLVVGLVYMLRSWGRTLRVVDTPTFCAMCQICYISAEDCRGAIPMARRWFRPHEVFGNEAWVCDLCIFDLLKATCVGSVASRLADSSWIPYGWELADWLLMLTVPSHLVTGANIFKTAPERSDDETLAETSARTPTARRSTRQATSPAAKPKHVGDSKKNK